jgi:predicted transposase/invertase (TIGR01784 family)
LKFSDTYALSDETLPQNLEQEEGISMAIESLRKAYASDEVREMIRAREKARLDYQSGLESARQEGHQEGRQEGLNEGRQESLQAVTRRMLGLGFTIEQIHQATGADIEQIKTWIE